MSREENRRCLVFVTASLLLHAAALSWLDLSGADVGRLPSTLTVLLESRSEGDGTRAKEPPASASRSRDLFQRPAAPVTQARGPAKAEAVRGKAESAPAPVATGARSRPEDAVVEEAGPPAPAAELAAAASAPPPPAAADPGAAQRQGELLSLLHQAISRQKRYPLLARRQRREGTTTVIFSLSPSGEMGAIGVDRSSGYSLLDTAAVDAVSRVAPFGPARVFLSDVTRFKVDVTFKLN
jgi:protein TonB